MSSNTNSPMISGASALSSPMIHVTVDNHSQYMSPQEVREMLKPKKSMASISPQYKYIFQKAKPGCAEACPEDNGETSSDDEPMLLLPTKTLQKTAIVKSKLAF
mmetsp:Transcript_18731/g.16249  ORF Transcript_18731/g.16249 Transcript_18731/m.16249 type:complete len:104 (-) Transcript_18731:222-533(-)